MAAIGHCSARFSGRLGQQQLLRQAQVPFYDASAVVTKDLWGGDLPLLPGLSPEAHYQITNVARKF